VAIILHQNLFTWDQIDTASDLARLDLVLKHLPDEEIVEELERRRGNGRDTYPVRPTWNAMLAGIIFGHDTVESLLRELRRNGELRQVCGFNTVFGAQAVPTPWAMSRFVANVMQLEPMIEGLFNDIVKKVTALLPDFGEHLAFDGKPIPSHSTGRRNKKTEKTSDPEAGWGIKTYKGIDKNGHSWEKAKRWFGYQLHLIVDSTHELPVAFEVKPANASETTRLIPMVEQLKNDHPEIVKHCNDLTADKGLDCGDTNKNLWQSYKIRPIIDTRQMWKDEKREQGYDPSIEITRSINPEGTDNIVYSERGRVYCVCPESGKKTPMQYKGFEADRGTLRYRCPAAAYGFECQGRSACEREALKRSSDYGRVVRIKLELDRRIFTPIPRDTPQWNRLYKTRSAVERVNSRIDQGLGFDHHTIRGLTKMRTRMGLGLAVMLAMAVGFISEGKPALMRSLVGNTRAVRVAA
jgi:hypothetical protein